MVKVHHVTGYDQFIRFIEKYKNEKNTVNILFSGSKLENGLSWCSDCVEASPFIETALKHAPATAHFIYVDVGDRQAWKDMQNPFRKNVDTHLSVIPTLIRWRHPQRLEGEQCTKPDLLEMFFSDED
ncbi:thioredoxin domain-containing protein 17-like [Malaya genurostris]|uniref:thioredoxin domain-containing protein 17-like n=1 Tax=Malaya genurostris TaxID=325434 RepID=UPI0026F3E68E|nr:thioredoxin domain-containing protein 17-like [Malaya genurostris]